jgi:hypothetical protein
MTAPRAAHLKCHAVRDFGRQILIFDDEPEGSEMGRISETLTATSPGGR